MLLSPQEGTVTTEVSGEEKKSKQNGQLGDTNVDVRKTTNL